MRVRTLLVGMALCCLWCVCGWVGGCASDVKQRQWLSVDGVQAEGGLPNASDVVPGRAQAGLNYPSTGLSSNEEQFSTVGPGSQTTLFNRSFGTAMVAGVLRASKVRALTQENDEITVEGLEIDNSANSAASWAKAIEAQVMAMSADQREVFKAQTAAYAETIKTLSPPLFDFLKALTAGL